MSVARLGLWIALLVAKLCVLLWAALHLRWVMDEFANAYLARYVGNGLYDTVDMTKTALGFVPWRVLHALKLNAVDTLHAIRIEAGVVAVAIAAAVAFTAHRLTGNIERAALSAMLALSFSNFVETATNARPDMLAVGFAVLAGAALCQRESAPRVAATVAFLAGLAFLCTQKTIYHVVALGLASSVRGLLRARLRGAMHDALAFAFGFAAPVFVYAVAFGGLHFVAVLDSVFFGPVRLSRHVLSGAVFSGLEEAIWTTLRTNAGCYVVSLVGVLALLQRFRTTREERALSYALVVALVTVATFLHPQPWPYVFMLCIPFLAAAGACAPELLPERWHSAGLWLVAVTLGTTLLPDLGMLSHTDEDQMRVIQQAEASLAPDDRYFDGVAMVPTRWSAGVYPTWQWDAPTQLDLQEREELGDTLAWHVLLNDGPKVWIEDYRIHAKPQWLDPMFANSLVRIAEVLWVVGRPVAPGELVAFDNVWTGAFHLVDGDGVPDAGLFVDGRACPTPCHISRGAHTVSASAPELRFLLPTDTALDEPLPIVRGPINLFENVYAF